MRRDAMRNFDPLAEPPQSPPGFAHFGEIAIHPDPLRTLAARRRRRERVLEFVKAEFGQLPPQIKRRLNERFSVAADGVELQPERLRALGDRKDDASQHRRGGRFPGRRRRSKSAIPRDRGPDRPD